MVNKKKSTPKKNVFKRGTPPTIQKNLTKQLIGIGAVAGMRATFAPAVLSHYLSKHQNSNFANSNLGFMASPVAAVITKLFAVSEIAGDKLPTAPDRIGVPQIFGRIASGAFAGAVVSKANGQSIIKGILIGGTSALAASFGAFYLRKYVDKLPHVKDVFTGAAEDLLALGTGVLTIK